MTYIYIYQRLARRRAACPNKPAGGPAGGGNQEEKDFWQKMKLKINKNKNKNANYMAYGYAKTLIKPCVFTHPGGPSGLRRALRPAGGLRPAWRANSGSAGQCLKKF